MKALNLDRYFSPIRSKLLEVEDELRRIFHSDIPQIQKLIEHLQQGKGKRLRPALVLLSSRFCQDESGMAVKLAAVFELVHTATLVHDDVIDHALVRRAAPTLNVLWGNTLTVLFGDLLYLQSMSHAIQARSWRMMEIFADVTTRMIEGELIQHHALYNPDLTREEYFAIQERKTALLFAACSETGALLAQRPESDVAALRRYGLELGRAFQLVDDLLDYVSTSEVLGKPAFSDLREGKITLPMRTLLDRSVEARAIVKRIWASEEVIVISKSDEAALRGLMNQYDALAETRELAHQSSRAAVEAIAGIKGDPEIHKLLLHIPELLLERSQ